MLEEVIDEDVCKYVPMTCRFGCWLAFAFGFTHGRDSSLELWLVSWY